MEERRTWRGRGLSFVRRMTASALVIGYGCGVDQVSGIEPPDVVGEEDEVDSEGSGGNTTNASGGSGGNMIDASGGQVPSLASGGLGAAGGPASPEEPSPVLFFACEPEENRIEVRGVRGTSCWLVVLERGGRDERCHEEPASSESYCVVGVRYSPEDPSCNPESLEGSNEYIATGTVRVKEGPVIELALDLSLPQAEWSSEVPFAVSRCRPYCDERDCRD